MYRDLKESITEKDIIKHLAKKYCSKHALPFDAIESVVMCGITDFELDKSDVFHLCRYLFGSMTGEHEEFTTEEVGIVMITLEEYAAKLAETEKEKK